VGNGLVVLGIVCRGLSSGVSKLLLFCGVIEGCKRKERLEGIPSGTLEAPDYDAKDTILKSVLVFD